MSQDQNAAINNGPPKRFLRKGEGLKRFAAYKPPLPTTTKKAERRQTFVRFRLDRNNAAKGPLHFIPPEILNDDSINLSTEIPKIAPPKIIHTPIRPNRNALGTLTNESSLFTDSQINGNIDNLLKKIEEKKSTLQDREVRFLDDDDTASFDYQNGHYRKDDNKSQEPSPHDETKEGNKLQPMLPETPREQLLSRKSKRSVRVTDLSSPLPGSFVLATTKQIEKIESTVNELREKLKNCECCDSAPAQTTRRRPTTRAAAKAAKSKASDSKSTGPSADADKNTTRQKLDDLAGEFAQLKASNLTINDFLTGNKERK